MSDIRKDGRKMFATPIDSAVANEFKQTCSRLNISMNTVLEVFMRDFGKGKFMLTMTKDEELNDLVFTFDLTDKNK